MKDPSKTPSPKVIAQAATGLVLIIIIAAINAVTPEMFVALGQWAGVAYAGVVALGGALAGYIKRDPLRK